MDSRILNTLYSGDKYTNIQTTIEIVTNEMFNLLQYTTSFQRHLIQLT